MGTAVLESVAQNYGKSEVLTRFSDPNWFQALGAVMGMQWNSSGVTATVLGSLKKRINSRAHEVGFYILGGKGKNRYYLPNQIASVSNRHSLKGNELIKASKLTGRIDENAVQDGYNLYQQYFILSDEGEWTAISQGMDTRSRRARRYHWHSPSVRSFVDDPHTAIVGMNDKKILNLADSRAAFARGNILSLINEGPGRAISEIRQTSLPDRHDVRTQDVNMKRLGAVLELAYNKGVDDFEDLVMLKGVGKKTLRSLALTSELIHGDSSRFEDPSRFSFAVGGKDGRPYPVDTDALDETIEILEDSVEKSKLGYKDKSKAIKRLHKATKSVESSYSPIDFLEDLLDMEWKDSEKNGGMTIMGKTIKGVSKAIVDMQNQLLYGKQTKN
jgi:hypothetical protein